MQEYADLACKDDLPLFRDSQACVIEPHELPSSERSAAKAKVMLEALKQGPVSTVDAETIVHRGQAVIRQLRETGHRIDTTRIDGELVYIWQGFQSTVKVDSSLQELYYQTCHWKKTSRLRREFDQFTCQQCGAKQNLEVHHWRYRLFAEDAYHDLITLCRNCHESVHEAVSGSSVHFPRFVSESIAERIRNNG